MYPGVPPEGVAIALPPPPLQAGDVVAIDTVNAEGFVSVTVKVAEQPLASVTLTV